MIRASVSTLTPGFILFAAEGYYAKPLFDAYLHIVRACGKFSPAEKAFRVSRVAAVACAQALKDKGFVVTIAKEAKALFFPPAPVSTELPLPWTFAATARMLHAQGLMGADEADEWKERMKEERAGW